MQDFWEEDEELEKFAEFKLLQQPLFQEINESHYRECAFLGPYGFVVGGMFLSRKEDLAKEYFEAGNQLLERIRQQEVEDFTLTNPILFLYRHSIEMLLKSRLEPPPKGHDLGRVIDEFARRAKEQYNEEVPQWIIDRIKNLAEIDPGSTAFRYAENYDHAQKGYVQVDGELLVELNQLQAVMKALHEAFQNVPLLRSTEPVVISHHTET